MGATKYAAKLPAYAVQTVPPPNRPCLAGGEAVPVPQPVPFLCSAYQKAPLWRFTPNEKGSTRPEGRNRFWEYITVEGKSTVFFAEELGAQTKGRFSTKIVNLCQVHNRLKISFIRYHIAIAFTRKDMAAMKREKHVGFRIENELHRKMVYIAEYEGRSLTWQMVHLMQDCVRQFEKEHGPIDIPPEQ